MALSDPNLPRPLVWHFGGMTPVAQIRDRNKRGEHIQHGAWKTVLKVKRLQSSNYEGAQCKAPRSENETLQLRKDVRYGCGVAYHPECRGECTPSVDDFMFAAKQIEGGQCLAAATSLKNMTDKDVNNNYNYHLLVKNITTFCTRPALRTRAIAATAILR